MEVEEEKNKKIKIHWSKWWRSLVSWTTNNRSRKTVRQ